MSGYGKAPIHFIQDLYWCFIPLACRDCSFLEECRKPFLQGRKCYNGCIRLNFKRKMERERDREDYLENLVKYYEEREGK